YQKTYDSNTADLEKMEQAHHISFVKNPPLTIDPALNYRQYKLTSNTPVVASIFDNMASGTAGIAFDLHTIPSNKLFYLAVLPQLLTGTGIIRDGQGVSYPDMIQQEQQQILSLSSSYSANATTG